MIPIPPGLSGPLLKVGGAILLLSVVFATGYWQGRAAVQETWDASIMQQQVETGQFIVQQAYNSVRAEKAYQKTLQDQQQQVRTLTKKVRDYETQTKNPWMVTPEFERIFDDISRVRQSTSDRLPASTDATGVADDSLPSRLADAAILSAYHHAASQLFACSDQLNGLIDWERTARIIAEHGAGR